MEPRAEAMIGIVVQELQLTRLVTLRILKASLIALVAVVALMTEDRPKIAADMEGQTEAQAVMDEDMEQGEALAEHMEEEMAAIPTQVDMMHHSMEVAEVEDIMIVMKIRKNRPEVRATRA